MLPASARLRQTAWPLAASAILFALGLFLWSGERAATREEMGPLLSTQKTVLGQTIAYPTGAPAKITSGMVTMQPGDETGWHKHDVPLYGYILEGELTVDYGAEGTRVYRKGDAVMEAIETPHNGRNTGQGVLSIVVVFMGADGVPNTELVPAPQ